MSKKLPFFIAAAAGALVLASSTASAQSPGTTGTTGSGDQTSTSSSRGAKTMSSGSSMSGSSMAKGADAKFVMNAAKGGMMEAEMGKMAAEKASSPDVKQFGQHMMEDHTKANDELKQVASSKGITLPSEVDPADKAKMDKMSKMSGDAFDRAYVADMLKDHKKDVADFKKEAAGGKDADVKGFASKTLPTLQDHLKMVQDLNAKMAGKSSSAKASGSR